MEPTRKPLGIEPDWDGVLEHIFSGAWGNPISFSAAPTLSIMDAGTWGYHGTNIYIKTLEGTGIKLTGASFS